MILYDDLKKVDNALLRAKEMLKQAREGTLKSVNYSFKPACSRFPNEPVVYQSTAKAPVHFRKKNGQENHCCFDENKLKNVYNHLNFSGTNHEEHEKAE
ncbi:hypothetical protein [Photobacterium leiognathi]|uniref:hypothetical protein n=1 Tax=Photobacterium leiognathi TaxID=553611 RepID=UPI0027382591|nr:hypothetical protein [Photobacterium leiognathi]